MLKRILIFVFLVFAVSAGAQAQGLTVREFYVQELRNDGYDTIKISRTFLGRLRFIGTQPGRRREIVDDRGQSCQRGNPARLRPADRDGFVAILGSTGLFRGRRLRRGRVRGRIRGQNRQQRVRVFEQRFGVVEQRFGVFRQRVGLGRQQR